MKYLKFLILLLPFILYSCENDEPEPDLFSLAIQLEDWGEIAMGIHDCEITLNGDQQCVAVTLMGDFDSFSVSSVSSWLMVTSGHSTMKIHVPSIADISRRTGRIEFTVYKGKARNNGSITITQSETCSEYL
ncbi:MAG: hypothetical protein Q4C34_05210 [Bacteroidales bacterium]|nr:hypothetical protein [Bacteroidales bacterium]